MWPDWVSNPGPLTYESGALPTALRGPADEAALYESALFVPFFFVFSVCAASMRYFHLFIIFYTQKNAVSIERTN